MNRKSIRLTFVALLMLSSAPICSAHAQSQPATSFTLQTALTPGMTAWITDSSGREERTRIVGVSADTVTTAAGSGVRHISATEVIRVRVRESDSLINGALIGAGGAVATGLLLCNLAEPWRNCRDDVGPMLRIGALGAGIGVGIDALIRRQKTIYEAPRGSMHVRVTPLVARQVRGLGVSFSF